MRLGGTRFDASIRPEKHTGHGMGWINKNNFYDQRKLADVSDVFRDVTADHTFILAVAISGHYFEN
jgi:hypothetical protein